MKFVWPIACSEYRSITLTHTIKTLGQQHTILIVRIAYVQPNVHACTMNINVILIVFNMNWGIYFDLNNIDIRSYRGNHSGTSKMALANDLGSKKKKKRTTKPNYISILQTNLYCILSLTNLYYNIFSKNNNKLYTL